MINLIKDEIKKDNPDWLLISNLAKKVYHESNKPDFLGIRVGMINHIKVGKYSGGDVVGILGNIFTDTKIINVGGYGLTVPDGVKIIKERKENETLIIVNDRDALIKHLGVYQSFRCSVISLGSYKNKFKWTNGESGLVTNFDTDNLRLLLRDYKLDEILN